MFRRTLAGTLLLTLLFGLSVLTPHEGQAQSTPTLMLVDINSAPLADIEAIVRDESLARRIIDNRPYSNKRQLVSRQLVSLEQYDEIKDRIVARRIETPDDSR